MTLTRLAQIADGVWQGGVLTSNGQAHEIVIRRAPPALTDPLDRHRYTVSVNGRDLLEQCISRDDALEAAYVSLGTE
jgi:hypothetical protein